MLNRKFIFNIVLSCILFVIGGLYVKNGVQLLSDAKITTEMVEKSSLYIQLGFNSSSDWRTSYMVDTYVRLGGGLLFIITGLYLLLKKKGKPDKPGEQENP